MYYTTPKLQQITCKIVKFKKKLLYESAMIRLVMPKFKVRIYKYKMYSVWVINFMSYIKGMGGGKTLLFLQVDLI